MELAQRQPVTIDYSRWTAVFVLAVLIHGLPMWLLTMPAAPPVVDEPAMAIDLSDAAFEPALAEPENPAKTVVLEEPKLAPLPPLPKVIPPTPPQTPAAPPAIPPKPPETMKPPGLTPAPPAPAAQPAPESPKLKPLDIEPFQSKPTVAFDESKTTKEVPKDGYLSDRNSTAADRGPKNLPRGDPFMDKGESAAIRYQQKRGENNLPPIPADDASGSVKKEGSPDAGKGTLENRPLDQKQPQRPVIIDEKIADNKPRSSDVALKPNPPAKTEQPPLETKILKPEAATAPEKEGLKDIDKPGEGPAPAPATPRPVQKVALIQNVAEEESRARQPRPNETAQRDPVKPEILPNPPKDQKQNELDAFRALLEGRGKSDARGGNAGDKVGSNTRSGEKGHEGNGTLRPGHDDAVSDVTTVNLESSAGEFDDARFAKRFDAKTAYVKPLARRIDGKWKADLAAQRRARLDRGIVTMKIVLRKDGKLIEATELERRPKDLPDRCVASVKTAIKAAVGDGSEPFPAALDEHDTLEFVFNFLY